MFFITRQLYDVISLLIVNHAYGTHGLCLICIGIKLGIVELLDKLGCSWHPIRSLGASNCAEKDRNQDAQEEGQAETLHHFDVAHQQHDKYSQTQARGAGIILRFFEVKHVTVNQPTCYKDQIQIAYTHQ